MIETSDRQIFGDEHHAFRDTVRRVLTDVIAPRLDDHERDGIVERTVHPTVPPKVEYALTDLGRSFGEPIRALGGWVFTHHERIQSARAEFDRRNEVDTANKLIKLG